MPYVFDYEDEVPNEDVVDSDDEYAYEDDEYAYEDDEDGNDDEGECEI